MKRNILLLPALMMLSAAAYAAPTEAKLDLGDFENSEQQITNGQNLEQAPFNFYYSQSGSQFIYTAAEIAPLYEHGAKISSISFRYGDPDWTCYSEFSESLKCYMQLIEASEFPMTDGKTKWFVPDGEPSMATATLDYSFDYIGGFFTVTLTFDTPFEIKKTEAGKNLLVTCTSDITYGSADEAQYVRPCVYTNTGKTYRMACYGNDNGGEEFLDLVKAGAEVGNTRSDAYKYDIPVARITYSYSTSTGIDDIAADDTDAACEVFSISGVKMGTSTRNLAKGIYIVKSGNSSKKIAVK